jgi:hypothetical protein
LSFPKPGTPVTCLGYNATTLGIGWPIADGTYDCVPPRRQYEIKHGDICMFLQYKNDYEVYLLHQGSIAATNAAYFCKNFFVIPSEEP